MTIVRNGYGFLLRQRLMSKAATPITTTASTIADTYRTLLLIVSDLEGSSFNVNVVVLCRCFKLPSGLHMRAKSSAVSEWVRQASSEEIPLFIFHSVANKSGLWRVGLRRKVWTSYLSYPKSKPKNHHFSGVISVQIIWLGIRVVGGT